jgi:predicted nucleic acid-binding protein
MTPWQPARAVAEKTVVDAGPLVALLNRRDAHHDWARAEFAGRPAPFYTCEAVLAEAEHLVLRGGGNPLQVLELLRRGALTIGLDVEAEAERLAKLQRAYRDQPMSLADACLVRLTELHARSRIFTTDSHFLVYRRNGRQLIPLVSPDAGSFRLGS